MDGYDQLIKTKSWKAIKAAQDALFDAQKTMESEGFSSDYAFEARKALSTAENQLRHHFKMLYKRGELETDAEPEAL